MEIQLRFFNYELHKEQSDDFPPNCSVKIDDVPVTLPVFFLFFFDADLAFFFF